MPNTQIISHNRDPERHKFNRTISQRISKRNQKSNALFTFSSDWNSNNLEQVVQYVTKYYFLMCMCSFLADDPLVADLSLTPCIEKVSGEDPPYYTQFYLSIMAPTGSSNLPFAQTFASSAIAACTAEVCGTRVLCIGRKPTLLYNDQAFHGTFSHDGARSNYYELFKVYLTAVRGSWLRDVVVVPPRVDMYIQLRPSLSLI